MVTELLIRNIQLNCNKFYYFKFYIIDTQLCLTKINFSFRIIRMVIKELFMYLKILQQIYYITVFRN